MMKTQSRTPRHSTSQQPLETGLADFTPSANASGPSSPYSQSSSASPFEMENPGRRAQTSASERQPRLIAEPVSPRAPRRMSSSPGRPQPIAKPESEQYQSAPTTPRTRRLSQRRRSDDCTDTRPQIIATPAHGPEQEQKQGWFPRSATTDFRGQPQPIAIPESEQYQSAPTTTRTRRLSQRRRSDDCTDTRPQIVATPAHGPEQEQQKQGWFRGQPLPIANKPGHVENPMHAASCYGKPDGVLFIDHDTASPKEGEGAVLPRPLLGMLLVGAGEESFRPKGTLSPQWELARKKSCPDEAEAEDSNGLCSKELRWTVCAVVVGLLVAGLVILVIALNELSDGDDPSPPTSSPTTYDLGNATLMSP